MHMHMMMPEPSARRARMGHRDETVSSREDDSGVELSGAERSLAERSGARQSAADRSGESGAKLAQPKRRSTAYQITGRTSTAQFWESEETTTEAQRAGVSL